MEGKLIEKKPFIGEATSDALMLVDRLKKVSAGETASYRELSQLIGRDITVYRHIMESARRILLRDHNMVFRCVKNEGYRRLDDAQVVDVVSVDRKKRIRTQARHAISELSCVEYNRLDKDRQLRHNTGLAMFGTLLHATSKASVKKISEQITNGGGKIDAKGPLQLIGWIAP